MTGFALLRRDGTLQKSRDMVFGTTFEIFKTRADAEFAQRTAYRLTRVVAVKIEVASDL